MGFLRRPKLRPIPEEVAYARCHGERSNDVVRVSKLEPRRPRYELAVSGERCDRHSSRGSRAAIANTEPPASPENSSVHLAGPHRQRGLSILVELDDPAVERTEDAREHECNEQGYTDE